MKKEWIKPEVKKISMQKITLSGTAGSLEANQGQGQPNRRA